ncbi:TetR/AcrR family transcriptional regulator [Hahella aquimaris]|uniref:Transcriptional regulator n=1 Tax=Hahella chejuensis (strain KCTC 2396) TaxID=349521 RepID=Q2SMY8_HAHCH|nr:MULTISPECIES: TetR/AcrR family transcriptional regulator [Hahella]ABC27986.1 Transcriptional regulator [Hahella chejuensis KCTC 2396]WLQ12164.1 TetR/AcrR family transcriptional regulator [Hahella sp. HNIBRBA332]
MVLKTNRVENPGRIRQKNEMLILRAAEIEFARHGFKGATVQQIADTAGLPKANVHYYFKSKHDLYLAVLSDIVELWNSAFDAIRPEDSPADALGRYIRSKVMLAKTHPLASKIFATEIISGAPTLGKYLKSNNRQWVREKSAVIQSWIDQGKIDPISPEHLIFLIWSATQHYADFSTQIEAVLGRKKLTSKDFDFAADNLIRIILKGCGVKTP